MLEFIFGPNLIFVFIILALLFSAIKILPEWERGVVLRLGRSVGIRGPGPVLLIPGIEKILRIDTRTVTMDIPPQDVISRDNVTLKVNAVIYFRVVDPEIAVTKVEQFYFATSQLAQTTLRSVVGQYQLDEILAHREKLNISIQDILDKTTGTWGVKVSNVEVKNIDLPQNMQVAMARQAEAERERRAKVISADGELERAEKLKEASNILAGSPSALQLAYLQAMGEIAGPGTQTIILPLPLDLLKPFLDKNK